jgi:hypothetical protein
LLRLLSLSRTLPPPRLWRWSSHCSPLTRMPTDRVPHQRGSAPPWSLSPATPSSSSCRHMGDVEQGDELLHHGRRRLPPRAPPHTAARLPELLLTPPRMRCRAGGRASTPLTSPASTSTCLLSLSFLAGHLLVAKSREVLVLGPRDPIVPLVRSTEGMEIDGDRLSKFRWRR